MLPVSRNLTIFVTLVLIFMLGMWGQVVLLGDAFGTNFWQAVYHNLQLFGLEGEWSEELDLPWQIEVTRLIAPVVSVAGVLFVLTQDTWVRVINYRLRFLKDNVVVAGLSASSWPFIQSCRDRYHLVVIEKDPENPRIMLARDLPHVSVIVGDPLDTAIYDQVNLSHAKHLVTFTGNDGQNVELTIKARNYIRDKHSPQLKIHMHVDDPHFSQRLKNYPKFFADQTVAQINLFSVYDLNARILLREYPPEGLAHFFCRQQVHIALYNFDRQAEHILLEATRICHFANASRVRFTVFDEQAKAKESVFVSDYPHVRSLCQLEFIETPIQQTSALDNLSTELLSTVTEHVVCFDTDGENLELAIILRGVLLDRVGCNSTIMVRMQQSSGLAQLLESNLGGPEIPDGLYPFGMLDKVLDHENVLADALDIRARAVHADYLLHHGGQNVDRRLYTTLNDWSGLEESDRKSNRLAADHMRTKFRAAGCEIVNQHSGVFAFTDEEVDLLARMDHARYYSNKISEGWRYGPERIESAKLSPLICTWEEQTAEQQQENLDTIKRLPGMLMDKFDQGLARDFYIGVTGHRLPKLDINDPRLTADIERVLARIVAENPGRRFVIMSSLAEGADRLVAKIAMARHQMVLHIPLPLPYELYRTDFTDEQSELDFRELVGKAKVYFELPMKFGNQEDLSARLHGMANDKRNRQYAFAGAYLVQHCHELIAIWDGEKEAGEGGTGQVVAWRWNGACPPDYTNPADFFSHPAMTEPIVINP